MVERHAKEVEEDERQGSDQGDTYGKREPAVSKLSEGAENHIRRVAEGAGEAVDRGAAKGAFGKRAS